MQTTDGHRIGLENTVVDLVHPDSITKPPVPEHDLSPKECEGKNFNAIPKKKSLKNRWKPAKNDASPASNIDTDAHTKSVHEIMKEVDSFVWKTLQQANKQETNGDGEKNPMEQQVFRTVDQTLMTTKSNEFNLPISPNNIRRVTKKVVNH